jgi:hypothetical protein
VIGKYMDSLQSRQEKKAADLAFRLVVNMHGLYRGVVVTRDFAESISGA